MDKRFHTSGMVFITSLVKNYGAQYEIEVYAE